MKLELTLLLLLGSLFCYSQDNAKFPNSYLPVKSINQLEGDWKSETDVLKIDTSNFTFNFNDGMKVYLDFNSLLEYNQFYIYGRLGSRTGKVIIKSRVRIHPDGDKIYLDRVDGGISQVYKKM